MQAQTIDFDAYRKTGTLQPSPLATAEYGKHASLKAELKRIDHLILSLELRITDLTTLQRNVATVEAHDLVTAAIATERQTLEAVKDLRTLIEASL